MKKDKIYFTLSILCILLYFIGLALTIIRKNYDYLFIISPISSILGVIFLILSKNKRYEGLAWLFLLMLFSPLYVFGGYNRR